MSKRYRILFRGKIQEGYDIALVHKLAAYRLNAPLEKIQRLFTGQKFFIKGGLPSEDVAERYVAEFAKIGMIVWAEPERPKPDEAPILPLAGIGVCEDAKATRTHAPSTARHFSRQSGNSAFTRGGAKHEHGKSDSTHASAFDEQIACLRHSQVRLQRVREAGQQWFS